MDFNLQIIMVGCFLAMLTISMLLMMLDRHLKSKHLACLNMGLFHLLIEKPFYTIRNELRNKIIWNKIKGELSRFKNKKNWKRYKLCKKYPFLKVHNVWTGAFCGYDFTWYDDISHGWQKAFGKKLLREIAKACDNDKKRMKTDIHFSQIKEKYGSLRLYASATRRVQCVLDKYEYLSIGYCEFCGKPAEYETEGYISYLCKDCLDAQYNNEEYKYDIILKDWSIKNNYKPVDTKYSSTLSRYVKEEKEIKEFEKEIEERRKCGEVWVRLPDEKTEEGYIDMQYGLDAKASYGITVEELWGINK